MGKMFKNPTDNEQSVQETQKTSFHSNIDRKEPILTATELHNTLRAL